MAKRCVQCSTASVNNPHHNLWDRFCTIVLTPTQGASGYVWFSHLYVSTVYSSDDPWLRLAYTGIRNNTGILTCTQYTGIKENSQNKGYDRAVFYTLDRGIMGPHYTPGEYCTPKYYTQGRNIIPPTGL